jgi:carbonic anhydrase
VSRLDKLFDNNRAWANRLKTSDPDFFEKLAAQQNPEYLLFRQPGSRQPDRGVAAG